ncbi:MAG: glutathione S-transferase family protein, partial [Stellaceae bacterium]
MRVLYHLWLSPFSRTIRLVLAEKGLEFSMKVEKTWERRAEFLALNPAGEVPVLIEPDGTVLAGASPIAEYLDEVYRDKLLIGLNPVDRAEVRRVATWFDHKMNSEVTDGLVTEKIMKRFLGFGTPDSTVL